MRQQSPSATAYLIAASLYALARDPLTSHLVSATAAGFSAHAVRQYAGHLFALVQALTWPVGRPLQTVLERLTVPGIRLHYALRKSYLEAEVRAALAKNFRRLVVLGAGFDTLAPRLSAEHPGLECVEVDHPATQRRKVRAASECGLLRSNLLFHASDFTARDSPVPDDDQSQPTIFVAEGLLMYLTDDEVGRLLAAVRRAGGAGSLVLCTLMEPAPDNRLAFHNGTALADRWLRRSGESFRWGPEPSRAAAFFAAHGFALRRTATADTLRQLYLDHTALARRPLPRGERLCVLERI